MNDTKLPPSAPPKDVGKSRSEPAWVGLFLLAFLLVNGLTSERTPAVWQDEVMYADPAINLYQGHGFVSGAWYVQGMDKFWAGNVPLFQFLLFGWLKIFGFGLVEARSFHYALAAAAIGIFWMTVRRLRLIESPAYRLVFCALLACSASTTFVYRNARPESLCIILVALVVWVSSFRRRSVRVSALLLLGAAFTWTGLQMAAYAAAMGGLIWFFARGRYRGEILALGAGCATGLALLFVFYSSQGVWPDFVASIRQHTVATKQLDVPIGGYGTFMIKVRRLPEAYSDPTFLLTYLLGLLLAYRQWAQGTLQLNSPLVFGLLAGLFLPLPLFIVGVFPIYYFWMNFIPLSLGVCCALGQKPSARMGPLLRGAVVGILGVICLAGLPRRLLAASTEWTARSYSAVMRLTAPYVATDDLVYSDFAAYFAAKQKAARVILPCYLPVMSESEKSLVTVAIIRPLEPGNTEFLTRQFGGEWRDTGSELRVEEGPGIIGLREGLGARHYNLKVFQRVTTAQ